MSSVKDSILLKGTSAGGSAVATDLKLHWDTTQTSGYAASHLDFFTQNQSGTDTIAAGARLRIDSGGNARFLVSGGSFTAEGTGAYGISIHNTNSPSMGHLFIYGDNGLIRFRNNSNTYTRHNSINRGKQCCICIPRP